MLPTHRLFRRGAGLTSKDAGRASGRELLCCAAGRPGPGQAVHQVWDEIETADDQGTIGLFTHEGVDRSVRATIHLPPDKAKIASLAAEHTSPTGRALGVSCLAPAAGRETCWRGKHLAEAAIRPLGRRGGGQGWSVVTISRWQPW